MKDYGKEIILDLHNCNTEHFNRKDLTHFFKHLCKITDMEACDLHFWDDLYTPEEEKQTEPHLVGTSAIQFIKTSNITIHTLDIMKRVYLNFFSCKDFYADNVEKYVVKYFKGTVVNKTVENKVMPLLDNVIMVENYWEAVGVIQCMKAGIDERSVRRPLGETKIIK